MKIIFLCGSLEPGKDGVGDYTRLLAADLILKGHKTAIVALNDRHISGIFNGGQNSEGVDVPVLRLPSVWSETDRYKWVARFIEHFNPWWLSLQFVPFSFHSKGLTFGLSEALAKLGHERRWHIMFHELWVGMDKEASTKLMCWGLLQRYLIWQLILKLKPQRIHTNTRVYQQQLKRLGFHAEHLPLFSNITSGNESNFSSPQNMSTSKNKISLVMFGEIHQGAPVEALAHEAALYVKGTGIEITLLIIGRCGSEKERWISAWKAQGLSINFLGEQPNEYVSEVLRNASFGISTTPVALVEKSGSVAAMRTHGLPVICVARSWKVNRIYIKPPEGVSEYRKGNLSKLLSQKKGDANFKSVSDISHQFLESLNGQVVAVRDL